MRKTVILLTFNGEYVATANDMTTLCEEHDLPYHTLKKHTDFPFFHDGFFYQRIGKAELKEHLTAMLQETSGEAKSHIASAIAFLEEPRKRAVS